MRARWCRRETTRIGPSMAAIGLGHAWGAPSHAHEGPLFGFGYQPAASRGSSRHHLAPRAGRRRVRRCGGRTRRHGAGVRSSGPRAAASPAGRWVQLDIRPARIPKRTSTPSAQPATSASPTPAIMTFCSAVIQSSASSSRCRVPANSYRCSAAARSRRRISSERTRSVAAGSRSNTATVASTSATRSAGPIPRSAANAAAEPPLAAPPTYDSGSTRSSAEMAVRIRSPPR